MSPVDHILDAMHVESSLYVRLRLAAPWGISFDSGYQARLLVVTEGECWLTIAGQAPMQVRAGDCLIIKIDTQFAMSDEVGRDLIPCSQVVDDVTGKVVSHGGNGDQAEIVSARLSFEHGAAKPLFALLPNVVHVRLSDQHSAQLQTTLGLIAAETVENGMGSNLAILRLIDVLFLQTIRAWFATEGHMSPGWLAGLNHRRLSGTIRLLHDHLEKKWTIAALAKHAGMSRSAFAQLFKSVVGDTPQNYILGWRIYRVKSLLKNGYSIAEAAALSGYGSDTALSRAFKSMEGVAPGTWLRQG